VVLLCGLQGSGKTTTAGKLAKRLTERGRHPLLVAADLQRAAAVEQLIQVGSGVGVQVLEPAGEEDVIEVARRAVKVAGERGHDVVIVDTAGRLHVDEALMAEIRQLAEVLEPSETLFVADAMTGQDAVRSAQEFAAALEITGVVLTKLDGDTRGGAALSIRSVADVPIRLLGVGEKTEDLELFHPDRMASRILGMGDVLSLIEKAEEGLDTDEAQRLAEKIARQEFTLEDLRDQLRQMRRLGPLAQIMEMLPRDPRGGDHRLYDPAGESPAGHSQRQPQAPDRPRLGCSGAGCESAGQAIPWHEEDAQGGAGQMAEKGPWLPRRPLATKLWRISGDYW
jgi:signal recognition particle subunit SRP54